MTPIEFLDCGIGIIVLITRDDGSISTFEMTYEEYAVIHGRLG